MGFRHSKPVIHNIYIYIKNNIFAFTLNIKPVIVREINFDKTVINKRGINPH